MNINVIFNAYESVMPSFQWQLLKPVNLHGQLQRPSFFWIYLSKTAVGVGHGLLGHSRCNCNDKTSRNNRSIDDWVNDNSLAISWHRSLRRCCCGEQDASVLFVRWYGGNRFQNGINWTTWVCFLVRSSIHYFDLMDFKCRMHWSYEEPWVETGNRWKFIILPMTQCLSGKIANLENTVLVRCEIG